MYTAMGIGNATTTSGSHAIGKRSQKMLIAPMRLMTTKGVMNPMRTRRLTRRIMEWRGNPSGAEMLLTLTCASTCRRFRIQVCGEVGGHASCCSDSICDEGKRQFSHHNCMNDTQTED